MRNEWVPIDRYLIKSEPLIHYYSRIFNLHPLLVEYLFVHEINNEEKIEEFLLPTFETGFHDPFLLNDMKKSIHRILKAIELKESILIFGDYDVDGITSTSLLYLALKNFNANISYQLPLRNEGYGLSARAIELIEEDISLIITVDNGTSSHEAMKVAKRRGIDVIVTDHHEILGSFPQCYAFINPMRHDSRYPFKSLSGAGVALKVVQAIYQIQNKEIDSDFFSYIELAALGTIADIMPIKGENRFICYEGLRKMNSNPHAVFKIIFDKHNVKFVDSSTIGFILGPIFNSCGRIGNPNIAVDLLTSSPTNQCSVYSLIDLNKRRKDLTKQQFQLADLIIKKYQLNKNKVIVVFGEFHNGIIGIIASRITEKYSKPAIVISNSGTGSARSVNGSDFSIINVISKASNLLIKHGGHQAAAGLSISTSREQLIKFNQAIQSASKEEKFKKPIMNYLGKVDVQNFSKCLFDDIKGMEPYGVNIPKPIFYSHSNFSPIVKLFGSNNEHVKLRYGKKEAIAFSKIDYMKEISSGKEIHLLYSPFDYHKRNFVIHSMNVKRN